jgi:3-hydroxybutyryl-CoA dehydrogenase
METHVIGITGIGLLGRGIAACFLAHGFRVIAFDTSPQARRDARRSIQNAIQDLVNHRCVNEQLMTQWPSAYGDLDSIEEMRECDFVIESVVEDIQTKRAVFDQLEAIVGPSVPIASNTSALPITVLQEGRRHPNRFIGMHWAEPSHVTRFLEVIRGEKTDDATTQATINLAETVGKEPSLVRKDVDGFIVNRLSYAMYREAFDLVETGVADVETIDCAFRNAVGLWAAIGGPFRWMDLTGVPAYATVMKRLLPKLSNRTDVPAPIQKLVDSGAKGISTGRGFYSYTPEQIQRWEKLLIENVWLAREMGDAAASLQKKKVE